LTAAAAATVGRHGEGQRRVVELKPAG